jgi:type IV pilus assembly protein PilW
MPRPYAAPHRHRGFSLIELMVSLTLGLVLVIVMSVVYLSSKTGLRRQEQISSMGNKVRTAFEYLNADLRMVGHLGCATSSQTRPLVNGFLATSTQTNFRLGIEGYNFGSQASYALGSSNPANSTSATDWATNPLAPAAAPPNIPTLPMNELGAGISPGLTPGSDVLVLRIPVGQGLRLSANLPTAATAFSVVSANAAATTGGSCSGNQSGFCPGSFGVISSCKNAQFFSVSAVTASGGTTTIRPSSALVEDYPTNLSEVFAVQTVAYYIKRSANGRGTALYRRMFDGANPAGVEQELIEGVENMQLVYGQDTVSAAVAPDQIITGPYVPAQQVGDWSNVLAVRVSLLLRSPTKIDSDTVVQTSGQVGDVMVTYPSGDHYERRVFTTTVALRNKVAYLP